MKRSWKLGRLLGIDVYVHGPAVNVAIAFVLYVWLAATGSLAPLSDMTVTGGPPRC